MGIFSLECFEVLRTAYADSVLLDPTIITPRLCWCATNYTSFLTGHSSPFGMDIHDGAWRVWSVTFSFVSYNSPTTHDWRHFIGINAFDGGGSGMSW